MSINLLVRRLLWGATTFCVLSAVLMAKAVQAQVLSTESDASDVESVSVILRPLEAQKFQLEQDLYQLEAISTRMNVDAAHRQGPSEDSALLDLFTLPLVSDLLDDAGNLDLGINLPFSLSVTDVMGSYGVVLSTDVQVTNVEHTWESVPPIDR